MEITVYLFYRGVLMYKYIITSGISTIILYISSNPEDQLDFLNGECAWYNYFSGTGNVALF